MERTVLLDKLSEFLMVEQGGLELYRVAAARASDPALKERYVAFGEETARHRAVLVRLIERLGGDPSYVSPTARLAQVKAAGLLETALQADGLSAQEIELNDLENLLLAETKDHADWHLLERLAAQAADPALKAALEEVVGEVEAEEDAHLSWAREELTRRCLQQITAGPAPAPERWQQVLIAPAPPLSQIHPAPATRGFLAPSKQPPWTEAPAVRELTASAAGERPARS
jgi:rubrerythrin